jgi:hypothetical protein
VTSTMVRPKSLAKGGRDFCDNPAISIAISMMVPSGQARRHTQGQGWQQLPRRCRKRGHFALFPTWFAC